MSNSSVPDLQINESKTHENVTLLRVVARVLWHSATTSLLPTSQTHFQLHSQLSHTHSSTYPSQVLVRGAATRLLQIWAANHHLAETKLRITEWQSRPQRTINEAEFGTPSFPISVPYFSCVNLVRFLGIPRDRSVGSAHEHDPGPLATRAHETTHETARPYTHASALALAHALALAPALALALAVKPIRVFSSSRAMKMKGRDICMVWSQVPGLNEYWCQQIQ